jgi:hypothetical protein
MTTHSVTFSRDNLIQLVLRKDFYEQNPELVNLQPELTECVNKFRDSGRKAGCGCRADGRLLFECFGHLLDTVNEWKNTDQERINTFVKYATKVTPQENAEKIILSVLLKTNGDGEPTRYEFTCP